MIKTAVALSVARHCPSKLAAALVGLSLLAAPAAVTALIPSRAAAQETLTPEQKIQRMFVQYTKMGGKVTYGDISDENGVLTVKDLKIDMKLPVQDPKNPKGEKVNKTLLITVDDMIIRRYDYKNPTLPMFSDGEVKGLRFDGELMNNKEFSELLARTGIKELVMDAAFKYDANVDTGTVSVDTYSVTVREFFRFSLSGKIDKIDFSKLPKDLLTPGFGVPGAKNGGVGKVKNPGQVLMAAFGQSRLHSLAITIADLGGVERVMNIAAEEQAKKNPSGPKLTVQQMRAQVKGMLGFANQKVTGAFAGSLLDAVGKLISGPGTLVIAAKPNQPVQFVSLFGFAMMTAASAQKPGQKLNLDPVQGFLGLTATFTPASR